MSTILTDLAASVVVPAIERHLSELFAAFGRLPGATFEVTPTLTWFTAPVLSPMFSGVVGTRLAGANLDVAIEETLERFHQRQVPMGFWWMGPMTEPADLGRHLEAHGLLPFEVDAPAMAIDLQAMDDPTPTPVGLRITMVDTDSALNQWGATFVAGFEVPAFAGQSWVDATRQLGLARAPWRLWIGWQDERPVAVTLLFPGSQVAGLFAVGTMPAARRQGIGAAMTLVALRAARGLGYRVAVLWSSDQGLGIYQRLGFQRYGAISRYLWRLPADPAGASATGRPS